MTDTLVHKVRDGLVLLFMVQGSVFEMTRDERENIFAIVDSIRAMGMVEPERLAIEPTEQPCRFCQVPPDSPQVPPEFPGDCPRAEPEPEIAELRKLEIPAEPEPQREPEPVSAKMVQTMSPEAEAAWVEQMSTPAQHGTTEGYEAGCRCRPCREAGGEHVHRWRMDSPTGGVVRGTCECGATREDPSDLGGNISRGHRVDPNAGNVCPECKQKFASPKALGSHRSFKHGVKGTNVHANKPKAVLAGTDVVDLGEAS